MRHILFVWHHDHPDEPDWILDELDADRAVMRRIERYRDGRTVRSSAADRGVPSLVDQDLSDDEILAAVGAPQFSVFRLDAEEFDRLWHGMASRPDE